MATELTIKNRDCISSPEDYTIVITITSTVTELEQAVNITFNETVKYTLEDGLTPHLIRVEIVYIPSNTAIEEWDPVIMYIPSIPTTDPGNY